MDYIPKVGDAFTALFDDRVTNNCPCVATKVNSGRVEALDTKGLVRQFYIGPWRFVKVEGFYSADIKTLNAAVHAAVILAKSAKAARKKGVLRSREFTAVSKPKFNSMTRALRKVAPRILGAE